MIMGDSTTKWQRTVALCATVGLGGTFVALTPSIASAHDETATTTQVSEQDVLQSLQNLESRDNRLVIEPVPADVELATEVNLPRDSSQSVVLGSSGDEDLTFDLPLGDEGQEAKVQADGTVIYPGEDSAQVIIPTYTGVQVLTNIANSDAPSEYSYEIGLSSTQRLEVIDAGAAIVNADGTTETVISAPWAKDAAGRSVPTHYEIAGNTLTQVVDHTSAGSVAYPVVADPVWIPAAVYRCLVGIGLNGPTITRMMEKGTFSAILAAGGYAAVRCVMGR
ncbi:hypothetical protein MN0502_02170 [Arthrobacter sp. MN05-02]|nr:hypothetical protein MN0502_02170 [Arthrobacter sp. MN05-02]